MALSDFWHELADKFRALDPTRCLRFQWISFPSEKRWETHVVGTGGACRTIKVQFEALATRAGLKLTSPSIQSSGLLAWLEAIQQFASNDRPSEGISTNGAGVTQNFIGGTIEHLCEVSADLCNALEIRALESTEDPYTAVLESLVVPASSESRDRLSPEARNRIRRSHIESDRFRLEAEASIESQHLHRDGQAATSERNKGNLQAARWVLSALRTEYSIFSEDEYRDYMKQEIEGAANSLELFDSQRRLLEVEFYYPEKVVDVRMESTAGRPPTVAMPGKAEGPSTEGFATPSTTTKRSRTPGTVNSQLAARRMQDFMDSKGIGQTQFAILADTTDRTIRSFRDTGKIRKDIFRDIAKAMGVTPEELLKPD